MSNSTTTHRPTLRSLLRSRGSAAAVGVCATAVLATAGVATAADGVSSDPFASHTATQLAQTTMQQADAQRGAAKAAEAAKEAAEARKDAKKQAKQEAERQAAEAKKAKARSWVPPLSTDYALSATYGNSGDRWAASHSGQDFAVPTGTSVHAVHGGTVVKAGGFGAGDGSAYGNAVVVKHDDDTYSQYAHLSSVEVGVGEKVTTGERIAESGNTGNSSGPHLHFEIRTTPDYGTAVDPVRFLHSQDCSL